MFCSVLTPPCSLSFPFKVNVRETKKDTEEGFVTETLVGGTAQIYKDLCRDSLNVNGTLLKGNEIGVNSVIGSFTMILKEVGAGILSDVDVAVGGRDVLLGCNRSRSGGDCYWVVNRCCVSTCPEVVLCPGDDDPKPIEIVVEPWCRREGVEGWVEIGRKRRRKCWGKVKEGKVEYFDKRGGRKVGEVQLKDAQVEEFMDDSVDPPRPFLIVQTTGKDVHLRFLPPTSDTLTLWKLAMAEEISITLSELKLNDSDDFGDGYNSSDRSIFDNGDGLNLSATQPEDATNNKKKLRIMNILLGRGIGMAGDLVGKAKKDRRSKSLPDLLVESPSPARARRNISSENASSFVGSQNSAFDKVPNEDSKPMTNSPKVQIGIKITVRVSNTYKICTADPDGEGDDTWAVVEAVFEQAYWLEKGEEVARGEESVAINLVG